MIYGNIENMLSALAEAEQDPDPELVARVRAEKRAIQIVMESIAHSMTVMGHIVGRVFNIDADDADFDGHSVLVGFRPRNEGDEPHPAVQAMDPDGEWG